MEDQDRVDYPDQYKEDIELEKVEIKERAHAVVNKKLVHYEIRGYNGDEDSIEKYYPCKCVEQELYEVRKPIGLIYYEKKGETFTFVKLPWEKQINAIKVDLYKAAKMQLKDWERKREEDDYDRKYL